MISAYIVSLYVIYITMISFYIMHDTYGQSLANILAALQVLHIFQFDIFLCIILLYHRSKVLILMCNLGEKVKRRDWWSIWYISCRAAYPSISVEM